MKQQRSKFHSLLGKKPIAKYSRRTSVLTVGICLFLISFMTVTRILFSPEVVAINDLRAMGRIYYEEYYYAEFVGNRSGDRLAAAFEPYTQNSFRAVTLRQLLTFDNRRLASAEYRFANCDKVSTHIIITPYPPYTSTDYDLQTTLVCATK